MLRVIVVMLVMAAGMVTRVRDEQLAKQFQDGFSTLDFSDLRAKGVGYARHRNPPKKR